MREFWYNKNLKYALVVLILLAALGKVLVEFQVQHIKRDWARAKQTNALLALQENKLKFELTTLLAQIKTPKGPKHTRSITL